MKNLLEYIYEEYLEEINKSILFFLDKCETEDNLTGSDGDPCRITETLFIPGPKENLSKIFGSSVELFYKDPAELFDDEWIYSRSLVISLKEHHFIVGLETFINSSMEELIEKIMKKGDRMFLRLFSHLFSDSYDSIVTMCGKLGLFHNNKDIRSINKIPFNISYEKESDQSWKGENAYLCLSYFPDVEYQVFYKKS